jgi:hypothetical protein
MVTHERRRGVRARRTLPVVVIGIFLALGALAMALGIREPTETTFTVMLRNDTGHEVALKQCDVTCRTFHMHIELQPNASGSVNTSASDTPNWWVVTDTSGKTLGCLLLRFDHKQPGLVVDISRMTTCPP